MHDVRPTFSAVTAGYMPLDIVTDGSEAWRRAGGTAGNVAAILSFLGWQAALAGRIGDDPAATELVADLDEAGVGVDLLQRDTDALTTRLVHEIKRDGHRYLYKCPRCSQSLPRSRPLTLAQVEHVLAEYFAPTVFFFDRANAATVALAEAYQARGTVVVYEPSTLVNAGLLQRAVAAASVIKGSDERVDFVQSMEFGNPDQLRVVTAGSDGARFSMGDGQWQHVGVFSVPVVDAAGAGDWTTAGLLHHLTRVGQMSPKVVSDGLLFGHALAALNCSVPGARGLAEQRTRASVLGLATRLSRGSSVVPTWRKPNTGQPPAGACEWCLLQIPKATAPSAMTRARA